MNKEKAMLAINIVRSAGNICLDNFKKSVASLKIDGTIVTNVDILVDNFLRDNIRSSFPDDIYISEESNSNADFSFDGNYWLADPIDGTSAFSAGLSTWGICLSHFQNNKIDFGIFFNPYLDEIYWCWDNGTVNVSDNLKLQSDIGANEKFSLCVNSDFHIRFRSDFPGKIRSFGSTAAHLSYVASGVITGCLFYNVRLWDIAASYIMLEKIDATIKYLDGKDILLSDYALHRNQKPALAAPSIAWTEIAERIKER